MDDVIQRLEGKIRQLIQQYELLQASHLKLKHSKTQLGQEKAALLARHKIAISQIESMVSRLKSIEKPQ